MPQRADFPRSKRSVLLKLLMKKGLSGDMLSDLIDPMENQPDEIKEQIAAELLEQF